MTPENKIPRDPELLEATQNPQTRYILLRSRYFTITHFYCIYLTCKHSQDMWLSNNVKWCSMRTLFTIVTRFLSLVTRNYLMICIWRGKGSMDAISHWIWHISILFKKEGKQSHYSCYYQCQKLLTRISRRHAWENEVVGKSCLQKQFSNDTCRMSLPSYK